MAPRPGVTRNTVHNHLCAIYGRFGVYRRGADHCLGTRTRSADKGEIPDNAGQTQTPASQLVWNSRATSIQELYPCTDFGVTTQLPRPQLFRCKCIMFAVTAPSGCGSEADAHWNNRNRFGIDALIRPMGCCKRGRAHTAPADFGGPMSTDADNDPAFRGSTAVQTTTSRSAARNWRLFKEE